MPDEDKKVKARNEFMHYAEKYYGQSWGEIPPRKQSIALARFYVQEIYNRTQSEISDDDLDLAVVDGKDDLGVDLIHREDNRVLIIQAKYRARNKPEEFSAIAEFQQVLERIANPKLAGHRRLEEKLSDIDFDGDSFILIFLSFGNFSAEMWRRSETDPKYPARFSDLGERCQWDYLDEGKLDEEYRNALLFTQGINQKQIALYPRGLKKERGKHVVQVESGRYMSYIMALEAPQIVNAYEQLGKDALFTLNIRSYIGKNRNNDAIQKTAVERPEEFFLFNNGVSCLCTNLEMHDDKVLVRGLQVINGAQTVRSLVISSKARRGGPSPWVDRAPVILTRITEIPEGYAAGGKLREEITKSNNTQNVIKDADFRSNDSIQTHLVTQFGELTRDGKNVLYVPKRTSERPDPRKFEVVKIKEFAKTVYPFLEDQISYSESMSFLFDDSDRGGYNRVFGDGKEVSEKMPTDEFRLRAAIYWVGLAIATELRKDRENEDDPNRRQALERKWAYIYGARCVLQMHFSDDDWKTQLRKLYKGDWIFGVDNRGNWVKRLYEASKAGVLLAYETEKGSNSKFSDRGWMRNPDTPQAIKRTLNNIKSLIKVDKLP